MKHLRKLYKFTPLFILVAIAALIWISGVHRYISLDALREHQIFLQQYVKENQLLSLTIYCLLYFAIVSLSIPAATAMTLIGGFLFGQIVGTICIIFSAAFGACVIFLSTKMASKNAIKKEAGKWTKKMRKGFEENAFSYMLTLRLIPVFPFVIVNLVAGILQIPLKTFFLGTLLGIIPGTFIYVSVGVSMQELLNKPNFSPDTLLEPQIILSLTGLGILALLPIIYKQFKKKGL